MITADDTACRTHDLANVHISGQTVHTRLRESGHRASSSMVGTIRNQRHRTARLAWARARRRWRLHTWQHILCSDESRFLLRLSDGRYREHHRRGERFTDQCVYESDRYGGGSVMVRTEICHDAPTQLKIVQGTLHAIKYRDDILDPIVLPFLPQRNFDHAFQHDNPRCHVTRVYQDVLNQNHIRVLP